MSMGVVEVHTAPGYLVRRAQQRHSRLWTHEFGTDLTGPQYAVVCAVGARASLDQRTVGDRASLDKSSTADVVARMQSQGWLRLMPDPRDGRRTTVELTPLARTALPEVTRRAALVQAALLEPVAPQRRAGFVASLRTVAYGGAAPPTGGEPDEAVLVLRDAPGHLLRRTQQRHTLTWISQVGRTVTPPQYAVLSTVAGHPEGIDQGSAAEIASLDKASMADVVRRLSARGWVTRTPAPEDARRRILRIRSVVRDDLSLLTPAVLTVQDRLLAPLGAKARTTFLDGLCRVGASD